MDDTGSILDRYPQLRPHRLIACMVLLVVFVLAACTEPASPNARSSAGPSARPTAAASIPTLLPTPTDYRSICSLEASVCSGGPTSDNYSSKNLPATLMRPLHLPRIGAGTGCPTTPGHGVETAGFGTFALGTGPVYPGVGDRLYPVPGGWFSFKTLWFVAPSYDGPVLIRGSRIDGNGQVGFGEQPRIGHLIIPPGPTVNEAADGYRTAPGGTFVTGPGCYAWQIDGLNFSEVIVFGVDMRLTNASG